jgi:hypothetical protein
MITIETLDGRKNIQVPFDTRVTVFILSQESAQIHNIFVIEPEKPITSLGF